MWQATFFLLAVNGKIEGNSMTGDDRLTVSRRDRIDDHVVYDGVRYVRSVAVHTRETT